MDDLLQEFVAETRETLDALAGEIVAWEADPADRARLDAIFRFVHTVKGSCGFLDLPRLGRLSHAAEDALAAVRDGHRRADRALVNAVLAVVDRIGEIVEAIDSGAALDDSGEDLLIAALDAEAAAPADELPLAQPAAAVVVPGRGNTRSVRLSVDLLDRMMGGMSEVVLARNELARRLRDHAVDPRVEAALERMSATVAEMRDTVSLTRMQKVDALFSALPRMVRDTAAGLGKTVLLVIDGADVELDREMVELMRDPLAHAVRNAIDHGIEAPAERRAAGKREGGRLCVSARQAGNQIVIEVSDDGRGVDVDRLVAKYARATGRSEGELRQLNERQRLELIFAPGLSSRDEATAVSGRGVGMDVVRANVEQLGGRVDVASQPGRGTTITIQVPLTLSIISTVVVGAGAHRFAVPRQAVEEIVSLANPAVRVDPLGDAEVATIRGRRVPLAPLGRLVGAAPAPGGTGMLVVAGVRDGTFALAVDAIHDTDELVVRPAAPAVMAAGIYAGQTLPDSGEPMLLLDLAGIAARAELRFEAEASGEDEVAEAADEGVPALLFDDLDGQRRALALAAVDRVEVVGADAVRHAGGRLRLTAGERTLPLVARGPHEGRAQLTVLRLKDGAGELGYLVGDAHDIVALPRALAAAAVPGPVAGVAVVAGEPVEVVDPFWLFAHETEGTSAPAGEAARPLCLIRPDAGGWMEAFLRPLLERAGYRVAARAPDGERPAVVLQLDGPDARAGADAPLLTLGATRGAGDLYRYDREAIVAAVARHLERAA
jgi:two-component system, chemotaxis family, sensor kinase CheA